MEFIDLLKVGANKQEVAIASSKITTPTIDMGGAEIQSVIALLFSPLMAMSDGSDVPPFDPTFGGEEVMTLAYSLPKEDFISTFGDILHVGTYNFYSSNADFLLSSASTVEETGESESTSAELNVSARVVSYPFLGVSLGVSYLEGLGNLYVLVPDDFMLKYLILMVLVMSGILDSSMLEGSNPMLNMLDFGIPLIDMPGQGVIFGIGLYSMLNNIG